MAKVTALLPLLLAACSAFNSGRNAYHDGMALLRSDPPSAKPRFERSAELLAQALPELTGSTRVTAASLRARALIELDRHPEADELVSTPIEGLDPAAFYEGDRVGLSLLRARKLDPDRAYAHLVMAETRAQTARARLHLAWQQARRLQEIGTPKAKAEALKICEKHPGKLDFDERRKSLGPN